MSRFFVGQRVRLVKSFSGNDGLEGRIRTLSVVPADAGWFDCYVDWADGSRDGPSGYATSFWQIEPILPEGHQPSEFTTLTDLLDSLGVTA